MQVADWSPAAAVIVAEPFPTAVITPPSTWATPVLEDFQVTVLFVASSGRTVAVSVCLPPTVSVTSVLSRVTDATGMTIFSTVTAQVAVLSPALAVIVAVPGTMAVTLPPSTVATDSLEDVHVMVLSVASSGLTVALRVTSSPTVIVRVDLSRVTPVTATGELEAVTLTEQVAFLPPSAVVAMMVALPTPLPVTVPLSSTVAMAESLVAQLTFLLVALDGSIVATRVWLSPTPIVMDDLSSFMPVTATEDPDEVTLTALMRLL